MNYLIVFTHLNPPSALLLFKQFWRREGRGWDPASDTYSIFDKGGPVQGWRRAHLHACATSSHACAPSSHTRLETGVHGRMCTVQPHTAGDVCTSKPCCIQLEVCTVTPSHSICPDNRLAGPPVWPSEWRPSRHSRSHPVHTKESSETSRALADT